MSDQMKGLRFAIRFPQGLHAIPKNKQLWVGLMRGCTEDFWRHDFFLSHAV